MQAGYELHNLNTANMRRSVVIAGFRRASRPKNGKFDFAQLEQEQLRWSGLNLVRHVSG